MLRDTDKLPFQCGNLRVLMTIELTNKHKTLMDLTPPRWPTEGHHTDLTSNIKLKVNLNPEANLTQNPPTQDLDLMTTNTFN